MFCDNIGSRMQNMQNRNCTLSIEIRFEYCLWWKFAFSTFHFLFFASQTAQTFTWIMILWFDCMWPRYCECQVRPQKVIRLFRVLLREKIVFMNWVQNEKKTDCLCRGDTHAKHVWLNKVQRQLKVRNGRVFGRITGNGAGAVFIFQNLFRLARLPVPTFFTIFFIAFILGWSAKGLKTFSEIILKSNQAMMSRRPFDEWKSWVDIAKRQKIDLTVMNTLFPYKPIL